MLVHWPCRSNWCKNIQLKSVLGRAEARHPLSFSGVRVNLELSLSTSKSLSNSLQALRSSKELV